MTEMDENRTPASEHVEEGGDRPSRSRRPDPTKMAALVGGAALLITLLFVGLWYFALRDDTAGRPVPAPRGMSVDDAPGPAPITGQTVTVPQEQQTAAGVTIETVGEQLAADVGMTAATGVVQANDYRNTPVIPLAGGIVRRIIPELGNRVARGQTVALVFSNEFADMQSRYIALVTEVHNARQNFERTQRLVAINQPGRTEFDAAARQMKAAEAALSEMQSRYQRTSRLVSIGGASREDLEQDNTKLRTAEAEVAEARNRYNRAEKLLEINPETRSENEAALDKLRKSESELAAAKHHLMLYGMSESAIASLRSPSQVRSVMEVPSPINGTVTSRAVNAGEVVEANKEMLRVTDLSNVWVIAQAFERDLSQLRTGSGASVTTQAYPDRLFRGQVTYIDPAIDEATRTAKVRVEVPNPGELLKLGMYVNVAFGALRQSERTVPVVPAAAVQTIDNVPTVFLATTDPNVFEIRQIRIGDEVNGRFPVLEGVNVGDRIVTNGSFMIRAEWAKRNQSQ